MASLSQPLRTSHVAAIRVALVACVCLCAAQPARAQHRARLSADLADHLTAGSQEIPVIVHGTTAEVDALATRYNLRVTRYLRSGAVLRVTAGQLAALQQDEGVDHLSGDIRIRAAADVTAESIGADQVWAGTADLPALTGRGVTVAVIDTGMDLRHHALAERVIATRDFTGGDGIDRYGHGTHVAGTIAGAPGATPDTREFRGIAYGARLVNLRALGDDGSGNVSDVVEAMDWAIEHRREFDIRVINLSLGTPVLQPYRDDPLCEAVERASAAGIVVVVAAGNYGRTASGKTVLGSITSPGNSPHALTVGALDTHGTPQRSDDTVAPYSSRGPTRYDLVVKPDIVAPGSQVVSAEAAGSVFATTHADHHVAGSGPDAYMRLSGTSMAAAVASGAVAMLLEGRRNRPSLVRSAFQFTASFDAVAGLIGAGAGSLDVLAAVSLLYGEPSHTQPPSIGGEPVIVGGIVISATGQTRRPPQFGRTQNLDRGARQEISPLTRASTIVGSESKLETIIWGQSSIGTIIWGQSGRDTIIWGQSTLNTIIWGQSALNTIIWGQSGPDTIIWGQFAVDTIIWGQAAPDTIIWGQSASDTIIWGQSALDTIIWGS
jgi:serine protease AprX